jgi:dolichyl-phosphate-mannose--protein O-mannosyl transferase
MSGFGLALVTQVKMVGLFLVASVGIATVIDLWELSDLKRGLSLVSFRFYTFSNKYGDIFQLEQCV